MDRGSPGCVGSSRTRVIYQKISHLRESSLVRGTFKRLIGDKNNAKKRRGKGLSPRRTKYDPGVANQKDDDPTSYSAPFMGLWMDSMKLERGDIKNQKKLNKEREERL